MTHHSKWFIKPEELIGQENLRILNITADFLNQIETDEKKNYWKYRSYDEIKENVLKKYYLSKEAFIVIYTNDKLMVAARFAWLLYWLGYNQIKILIGRTDIPFEMTSSSSVCLPTFPGRSQALITCDELISEFSCSTTKFIDVRTYREYSGEITGYSYVKTAGRIPNFQFDLLDGIYGEINGDLTWQELEEYLELMRQYNANHRQYKRLIYMCGTGWRASLAVLFADELNLAEILTVLDSGWYEWSERVDFHD